MQAKSFSLGAQEYLLEAVAVRCGNDLTVVIGGGEKQHIGAVAVGVPRPSLKDKNIVSSSASVLCLTGHKEDLLARKAALELARMLGHTVTVTVGLHIDDASAEAIAMLEANFQELLRRFAFGLLPDNKTSLHSFLHPLEAGGKSKSACFQKNSWCQKAYCLFTGSSLLRN